MTKKRVAVLMGGWSVERDVSLDSGRLVGAALQELGHEVVSIDVTRDLGALMAALMPRPDVVFNALHGVGGEDGTVQGVLEVMGIPYTHSGVDASAIAMNKVLSRRIFAQEGIAVPSWKIVSRKDLDAAHPMPMPYVIKPVNEGSSRGVYIIRSEEDFKKFQKEWVFGETALIEKCIDGREIQVGVMGNRAIGAIEIRPREAFYDYTAKYTLGRAEHFMPAPLSPSVYEKVLELGLKAHQLLGCRSVSRSDFMYDEAQDQFYLLELNTQPGLSPLSLLPEIAAHEGITFNQLISWMVDEARCDHQLDDKICA
ncbi:MAG: D-alanine--D-alanine ligase [Alphaproteobacteria bacterium]|jgi:D-alanine-D-alanine ligase|nr:D-alanine--D-alanine ligase [Alphaproteobacteria bacterium]